MNVRLVLDKGKSKKVFRLKSAETIIGRRQDCDLRVASAEVSRRHCLLSVFNGYLNVQDLDSVNGTFLNGKRIAAKEVVRPGDRIDVGPAHFTVEYELTREGLNHLEQLGSDDAEAVEDLPVVELDEDEGGSPFEGLAGLAEELPVAEVDTDLLPTSTSTEDDDPIPMHAHENPLSAFDLPPEGDLRDILVEMEDSKKKPKRGGK